MKSATAAPICPDTILETWELYCYVVQDITMFYIRLFFRAVFAFVVIKYDVLLILAILYFEVIRHFGLTFVLIDLIQTSAA